VTLRVIGCLLVATLGFACHRDSPEATADHFVDLALASFDQEAALPLAEGRARHRLERELRLIGASRASASWEDSSMQSSIYYDRGRPKRLPGDLGPRLRFPYVLTIHGADAESTRHALVTVEKRGGSWKVVDYETFDQRSQ
jgi:hypothetical protein